MSSELSVAEILANLEAQIALHREREAFHAEQKVHHQEEQARHAAELEALSGHYETFKAAAAGVQPVIRIEKPAPSPSERDGDLGDRPKVSRALARVVESWPEGDAFGPSAVAAEVNRRFAGKLRQRVDTRAASVYLRRRREDGSLESVREGRPLHEALYRRRSR